MTRRDAVGVWSLRFTYVFRAFIIVAAFGMVGAKCSCTPTSPTKAKCDAPACASGETRVCQDLCVTPGKLDDPCVLDPCAPLGTCDLGLVCLPAPLSTLDARFCQKDPFGPGIVNGIGAPCSPPPKGQPTEGCPSQLFCKSTSCKVNPITSTACAEPQAEGAQCDSDFNAALCLPCEPGTTCIGLATAAGVTTGVCKKPCATAADCPCDGQTPPRDCVAATGTGQKLCSGCATVGSSCGAATRDTSSCCGSNRQECGVLRTDGVTRDSTCCVGLGGKCDPKAINDDCCENKGACAADGVCREKCTNDAGCFQGEHCGCKGVCEASPPLGSPCTAGSPCQCGPGAACEVTSGTTGRCVETCATAAGATCAKSGLTCVAGFCVSPPVDGSPCKSDAQCSAPASGLLCSTVDGKCHEGVCRSCKGNGQCAQEKGSTLSCDNGACCIQPGSKAAFPCTTTAQCCAGHACVNGACIAPQQCNSGSSGDCPAGQECVDLGNTLGHVCSATVDATSHKTACADDYGATGGGCSVSSCSTSSDCCKGDFCNLPTGDCICVKPNQGCDIAEDLSDPNHPQCCVGHCVHQPGDVTGKGSCGLCKALGEVCTGNGPGACCPSGAGPDVACVKFDVNAQDFVCGVVNPPDSCAGSGQFCRFHGLPTGNPAITIACCPDPGESMSKPCPTGSDLCP